MGYLFTFLLLILLTYLRGMKWNCSTSARKSAHQIKDKHEDQKVTVVEDGTAALPNVLQDASAQSPVPSIASSASNLEKLPNELFGEVMEHVPPLGLIRLAHVSRHTRILVAGGSARMSKAMIDREIQRLQDAMKVPGKPNYKDFTLLDALILWCSYWGFPHFTLYRGACEHFSQEFDHDNLHSLSACVSSEYRIYFWSRLAEFLLCISDISPCRDERGRPFSGPVSWVEERAAAQFQRDWDSGQSFLGEVVQLVEGRSHHFCFNTLLSLEQWMEMVTSVCKDPIQRPCVSTAMSNAKNRQELQNAVDVAMGRRTSLDSFLQGREVGLPVPAPGFRYVPKSNFDADYSEPILVQGVRPTLAAKVARIFCEQIGNPSCPVFVVHLLRALLMQSMDVCDSPFDPGRYSPSGSGQVDQASLALLYWYGRREIRSWTE